jgi:hypothetical protein
MRLVEALQNLSFFRFFTAETKQLDESCTQLAMWGEGV